MARVAVVGAGYVGLCTAVALAEGGHDVTVVEVDPGRLARVRAGDPPFFEPGLAERLRRHVEDGRLRASHDLAEAARAAGFVFLCVGTPRSATAGADLSHVRAAARTIAEAARGLPERPIVVTKSTVPPGTARHVVAAELGPGFGVASNPEFLREGTAMADALSPDRIVVGVDDPAVGTRVWTLYEGHSCPKLTVDTATAETIKYAANAFLAAKVGLSNELANVAAAHGVDWYRVADGIGLDARIGPLFLRAGAGFGGSCFPKDVAALAQIARESGASTPILEAILAGNEIQPLVAIRLLEEEIGPLDGKRVALLGLAFKPDTDDVRETRALPMYEALVKCGARVVVHDPRAADGFARLAPGCSIAKTVEEALAGADGSIFQTEWAEYRALEPTIFRRTMRQPVVVDGRRTFDATKLREAGVRYRAIGLGARP